MTEGLAVLRRPRLGHGVSWHRASQRLRPGHPAIHSNRASCVWRWTAVATRPHQDQEPCTELYERIFQLYRGTPWSRLKPAVRFRRRQAEDGSLRRVPSRSRVSPSDRQSSPSRANRRPPIFRRQIDRRVPGPLPRPHPPCRRHRGNGKWSSADDRKRAGPDHDVHPRGWSSGAVRLGPSGAATSRAESVVDSPMTRIKAVGHGTRMVESMW